MKENIVSEKSYQFAKRIVGLYLFLKNDKREFELGKQILRSGTSIGANIEEAIGAMSRKDFAAKIGIAYRESREVKYWLRLLHDTNFIDDRVYNSMSEEIEELLKIIGSILKTLRGNNSEK